MEYRNKGSHGKENEKEMIWKWRGRTKRRRIMSRRRVV
jgi:hypothetical protein